MDVHRGGKPAAPVEAAEQEPPEPPLTELRPQPPAPRLNRPRRAIVAAAELALAAALAVAAVWAWRRAAIPYELPTTDNPAVPRLVTRWSGPWVGAAFGLAALAGMLVLDAVRQLVLAVRVRGKRTRPTDDQRELPDPVDE